MSALDSDRRRDLRASVLLGIVCLLACSANCRGAGSGDSPPAEVDGATKATGSADLLAAAARLASTRVKADQQAAGYWLTQFTAAARFDAPHPEMNTFLTAMMIDLLDPVAASSGLEANLAGARAHLRDQIEADGLVRFHGRPDAPTIGTLGCRITPDADDTALAWRIAAANLELRPRALAVLDGYRTREGLYRTWLAPRERYECIDPGSDPNPADAGIQMHVYLFLEQADPSAARALCRALPAALAQDRHWVYYARAPLVPLLRLDDLRRAGCPLRPPPAMLSTTVEGQEIWLAIARALAAADASSDASRVELLRTVAADDFALVRRSPPLLYHNDLTASVSRYYWSEDFGYALWLRLYLATARGARVAERG